MDHEQFSAPIREAEYADLDPDLGAGPDTASADGTGNQAVDSVLLEVAGLAGRPVSEHVAVFDRAHEQLRRALDARPEA